jgi:hypothetical protein
VEEIDSFNAVLLIALESRIPWELPMIPVVCQVVVEPNQINFKWSAGAGEFKPYALVGAPLRDFRRQAQNCRKHLKQIVEDHLAWYKASSNDDKRTWEQSLRKSVLV